MNLLFIEGPAGSGKTTRLMEQLVATLEARPLNQHERVLALTKMHGSRRRMQQRLSGLIALGGQFDCVTFDSFAWRLLRRWRSLGRAIFGAEAVADEYDEVCRRAGVLLASRVGPWVTSVYPIVVIDEMQDSKDGQLDMIKAFAASATCIVAADDFQDLDGEATNAAVAWARSQEQKIIELSRIHRTTASGLLDASTALRAGHNVPAKGPGFCLLGAQNHNVGASHVSRTLTWWYGCKDIAVLSPVRGEKAPFVKKLLSRVEQAPIGKKPVGPFRVPWETSPDDEVSTYLAQLTLPVDLAAEVDASIIKAPNGSGLSEALNAWLDMQRRVAGCTRFTVAEIQAQVRLIHQRRRAYSRTEGKGIRAMTIHQAKNREFDSVIVVWPYQVQGSTERLRRLLYNAITRAKSRAIVVVQNPELLNKPPFTADV